MTALPETKSRGARRRWPLWVLVGIVLVALALLVEAFLREESFSPGEEILIPGIRDVSVSVEDTLYPPPNVGRFASPPEIIFVYLSGAGALADEDMEITVERSESASAFAVLLGRGSEEIVVGEQEAQLGSDGSGGTAVVVKFSLKTRSGEPVPTGNYTLKVYGPPDDGGAEQRVAVRKYFVIEG